MPWMCATLGLAMLLIGGFPLDVGINRATKRPSAELKPRRPVWPVAISGAVALLAMVAGGDLLVASALGLSVFRCCSTFSSWKQRRRLRDDSAVASQTGRALVREIAMGCSTAEAIVRAADSLPPGGAKSPLHRAAQLVRLGENAESALLIATDGMRNVEHVACVAAASLPPAQRSTLLERAVAGIEADAKSRADVRANLSEPRFVALAVPVLGAVLALLLSVFEPAVMTVAESTLGVIVCLLCVTMCASGAVVVLRMTRG